MANDQFGKPLLKILFLDNEDFMTVEDKSFIKVWSPFYND